MRGRGDVNWRRAHGKLKRRQRVPSLDARKPTRRSSRGSGHERTARPRRFRGIRVRLSYSISMTISFPRARSAAPSAARGLNLLPTRRRDHHLSRPRLTVRVTLRLQCARTSLPRSAHPPVSSSSRFASQRPVGVARHSIPARLTASSSSSSIVSPASTTSPRHPCLASLSRRSSPITHRCARSIFNPRRRRARRRTRPHRPPPPRTRASSCPEAVSSRVRFRRSTRCLVTLRVVVVVRQSFIKSRTSRESIESSFIVVSRRLPSRLHLSRDARLPRK